MQLALRGEIDRSLSSRGQLGGHANTRDQVAHENLDCVAGERALDEIERALDQCINDLVVVGAEMPAHQDYGSAQAGFAQAAHQRDAVHAVGHDVEEQCVGIRAGAKLDRRLGRIDRASHLDTANE